MALLTRFVHFCLESLSEDTKFDNVKGLSPRYAPPEVFARIHLRNASNTVDDDKFADVYSIGVVIWETMARQVRVWFSAPDDHGMCEGGPVLMMPRSRPPSPLSYAQVPWDGIQNEEIELHVRGGARVPLLEVDPADQILVFLNNIVDTTLDPSPNRRPTIINVNKKFADFVRDLLRE